MNVRDVMTEPMSVTPETPVGEVARLVLDRNLPGVPVVDEDGTIHGIVRRIDLVAKHASIHAPIYLGILGFTVPIDTHRSEEDVRKVLSVSAADLMSEHPPAVGPDTTVDDAAREMEDERADPLLVVEDGRLLGLLSQTDIIRLLVREEADEARSAAGTGS